MIQKARTWFTKLDVLLLLIFLLFLAGSTFFLAYDAFVVGLFFILLSIFLYRKCSFDVEFFIVLALWCVVNLISYLVNNELPIITFLGSVLRMCIPYFVVKIIGASFFEKLFRFLYILVIIASCCYIIEVIAPSFVNSLTPHLNFLLRGRRLANGDFYIIVYNHLGLYNKYYGIFPRNSGFMWEPGAYAWILNFMIIYKLHRDNYVLDRKILLLILALILTFSTAGYLGLFFIAIFYLIKRGSRRALLLLPFVLLVFVYGAIKLFNTADFLSEKLDNYQELGMEVTEATFEDESWMRVTRIAMGRISLENSLVHPWGDGVNLSSYIVKKYGEILAPNALASLLCGWGWLGFIAFIIAVWRFNPIGLKKGFGPFLFIPLFISLFSNPYSSCQYFMYAIFYYSIICKNFQNRNYVDIHIGSRRSGSS
ncbi:MAG: hypothetical protein GX993_00550 [Bacteroidales bacterium]|nr:hypothetical protein [Bacteroidales bacterium]